MIKYKNTTPTPRSLFLERSCGFSYKPVLSKAYKCIEDANKKGHTSCRFSFIDSCGNMFPKETQSSIVRELLRVTLELKRKGFMVKSVREEIKEKYPNGIVYLAIDIDWSCF